MRAGTLRYPPRIALAVVPYGTKSPLQDRLSGTKRAAFVTG
jgi:hypothetical protein